MGPCVELGEDGVPFIQLGIHQLRLDLEEISGSFKETAINDLREVPENVEYGLNKLRELIRAEPGLNVPLDDDAFLTKFLRPCKWYPESAFKLLKKFYKFKVKYPKMGANISPNRERHVFDSEVVAFLPSRTSTGSRIMIVNAGTKWNPKEVKIEDMFRAVIIAIEIAMLEPKTQVGGVHVILNMQGLSLVHCYQFSPHLAKLILEVVQECAPVRLRGIHVINQPYIFNMVYAIFKPFIGEKLKKRLMFHGTNRKPLVEQMSAECLPEYFGGTAEIPEFPGKLFSDMLFYYQSCFELHNSYGYVNVNTKEKDKQ